MPEMSKEELKKMVREMVEEERKAGREVYLSKAPKQKTEPEKLEVEDEMGEDELRRLVEEKPAKVEETWDCPKCDYKGKEKFKTCPSCGQEVEW